MNNNTTWRENQSKLIKKIAILRNKNDTMREKLNELDDPILDKVASNMYGCATYLSIAATSDQRIHINNANFCRERLCAICAWRRQSKFIATSYPVLEHLSKAGYKMLMITLTMRNCAAENLDSAIKNILSAWTRLTKAKLWQGVKGAVRALEVTYNEDEKKFHPHIHAILIMPEDYSPIHDAYINYTKLSLEWQRAMRVDYVPIVHITLLRSKRNRKAYIEVMKYALKPANLPSDMLQTLYYALKGKRLISFSGLLAKLRKAMDDDTELTDTIPTTSPIIAETVYALNTTGGLYEILHQTIIEPSGGMIYV